jgi:predicted lipoprotein
VFANADGNDVGSGTGMMVNQLNYDWETLKNIKIGIPLGKKTLGTPLPDKVEGYYSGISMRLAVRNAEAMQALYLGNGSFGSTDIGLDDNLETIEAKHGSGLLNAAITAQFTVAIAKLKATADPLSARVTDAPAIVDEAYLEMQKLVVLLKSDMPSALGVLITYQDNDGD